MGENERSLGGGRGRREETLKALQPSPPTPAISSSPTPLTSPVAEAASGQYSSARTMAQMLAQPSNRSCADCRVTLVDTSQVYVSLSPPIEIPKGRYNQFLSNHQNFAPPGHQQSSNADAGNKSLQRVPPPPIDPALVATNRVGGHGVFICAMCAAAHKLLGPSVAIVHAVQDTTQWTTERVHLLATAGSNARAQEVLEKFMTPSSTRSSNYSLHPRANSTIAQRLSFARAKYEALAFCLPPSGPVATRAWRSIVNRHPEWKGLWGADLFNISDLNLSSHQNWSSSSLLNPGLPSHNSFSSKSIPHLLTDSNARLPNRLVDYFCVVEHSPFLDAAFATNYAHHLAQKVASPEDIVLAPVVTHRFPERDAHQDMDFPEHLGFFVSPEGYRPSSAPLPPTFFTFVLTSSDGNRMYGGALRVHDKSYGPEVLRQCFVNSNLADKMPEWLSQEGSSLESPDVIYLPKCLVVLSHYPFFDLWRKALLTLYRIVLVEAPLPIERFIANFCAEVPLPPPGRVQVRFGFTANEIWSIERPPENTLPLANFSFRPLFASLSITNVMVVVGCILQETRIALLSQHYALLTPVAQALASLLFPFRWQGLFIPILPYSMLDVLDSPVPFIVGLNARYLKEVPVHRRPRGVTFVDLDNDVVHLGYDEELNSPRLTPSLPERDAVKLKAKLVIFAASAYLVPGTKRVGQITSGDERPIAATDREAYAQMPTDITYGDASRRDMLTSLDKAYTDIELISPLTGFVSEQGQYHDGDSNQSQERHLPKKRRILRLISKQTSTTSQSNLDQRDMAFEQTESLTSLLDLRDPKGFSTSEVREAFLRFFVSILKGYRTFMEENFNADAFVSNRNLSPGNRGFIATLTQTQLFQRFIQERRESPNDPECVFFDESINAKINRSKLNTLANLGRGGKRRETSFIDDHSKKATDVYTPQPPSNLGLPDRTYQYGSFPDLDPSLYGKTRNPREWPSKAPTIRSLRQSLVVPIRNAPTKNGSGHITGSSPPDLKGTHRNNVTTLEGAIQFLSRPFMGGAGMIGEPEGHQQIGTSGNSNSSLFDLPRKEMSLAEEVVLNARRKVSILVAIFIQLQAISRGYMVRHPRHLSDSSRSTQTKELSGEERRRKTAGTMLMRLVLIFRARRKLLESRGAAILIQAVFRGRRATLVFRLIRQALARVQAHVRRWIVQRRIGRILVLRLAFYAPQLVTLWRMAHTPLAYRTKFWRYTKLPNLLCHGIVETELRRLVKELTLQPDESRLLKDDELVRVIRVSDRLGMSSQLLRPYTSCTAGNGGHSSTAERESVRASSSSVSEVATIAALAVSSNNAAARVSAERTQIYEKLSTVSSSKPNYVENLYSTFNVPSKDKRRKVTLAEAVWNKYSLADESVKLMLVLFPELLHSTNIKFSKPSSKGIRRIRSSDTIPDPLDEIWWSHTLMERRIRKNLAVVASVALLYVPRGHAAGDLRESSDQTKVWKKAITSLGGHTSWQDCRLELMRRFVHPDFSTEQASKSTQPPSRSAIMPSLQQADRSFFPDLLA